jgi:hypothetical protein
MYPSYSAAYGSSSDDGVVEHTSSLATWVTIGFARFPERSSQRSRVMVESIRSTRV